MSLVISEIPRNPQSWLPQILRVVGADAIKSGSVDKGKNQIALGQTAVEHVAELYEPRSVLHLDLGGPPLVAELRKAFASIAEELRGDFAPSNMSLRVGKHKMHLLRGGRIRQREVGFQLSIWGYSSPRDDVRFVEAVTGLREFTQFKAEIDALVGMTEVAQMVYG